VGKSFTRGDVDDKFKELARGNGVYILTASTASQTAQEREGDDYGLLTKHIISGVRQGAADADDDGLVSMDDLYQYVYAKVKSEGYQEPMRWALNVKGEELILARASGTSGREKQRLLNEKIIEFRDFLPRQIFRKALDVIDERRAPFYELIDELHRRRLQIGEFVEEWYRLESIGRQQQPKPPPSQPPLKSEKPAKIEVVDALASAIDALARRRKLMFGGLAAAVALVALSSWLMWQRTSRPDQPSNQLNNQTTQSTQTPAPAAQGACADLISEVVIISTPRNILEITLNFPLSLSNQPADVTKIGSNLKIPASHLCPFGKMASALVKPVLTPFCRGTRIT